MARVIQTPLARKDLKDIGRYIKRESHDRAVAIRFISSIEQKYQMYAVHPEMGEPCPDLHVDVRLFSVGNYVVIYRIIENGIQVIRVLHGNRDIPSEWGNLDT